jgi:hypothetical protein
MSVVKGFAARAGLGAPQDNAPASAAGDASRPYHVSAVQSTIGGVGDSPTGLADAASYRRTRANVSGIADDCDSNCAAGGMALPTGEGADFRTTGQIPSDSNLQATTTAGGPLADHSLVRRTGGGDTAGLTDSNMGAGGKYVG